MLRGIAIQPHIICKFLAFSTLHNCKCRKFRVSFQFVLCIYLYVPCFVVYAIECMLMKCKNLLFVFFFFSRSRVSGNNLKGLLLSTHPTLPEAHRQFKPRFQAGHGLRFFRKERILKFRWRAFQMITV